MRVRAIETRYKKLFHYLFLVFLFAVFCCYCVNIHLIYVPDSDFFAYLREGHDLLINPLARVVEPPLYSVVVYLFEAFLPIKHPGLVGGTIFNIICFVVSLWYLWNLSKRWMGWYGLLPVILLSINPLSIFVNLQPTNIPIGVLLVFMAIYYNEEHPLVSYILALLAFFARPEAAGVLVVFAVQDFVIKKRNSHPVWLIVAFSVVVLWYVRPILAAQKGDYLAEMTARRSEIPNFGFLRNSFAIAPFLTLSLNSINSAFDPPRLYTDTTVIAVLVGVWITYGTIYCYKKRILQPVMAYGYIVLYTLVHVIFPDRVLRYSYPITPFVYVLLFWPAAILCSRSSKRQKIISTAIIVFITLVIVTSIASNGRAYIESQRWLKAEKRLVAEWLDQHVHKPTTVYIFEPWISQYYTDNTNIFYANTVDLRSWSYDLCYHKTDTYVIIDGTVEQFGAYLDYLNGVGFFRLITKSRVAMSHLAPIKTIMIADRWATIYAVSKTTDNWCTIFAQ